MRKKRQEEKIKTRLDEIKIKYQMLSSEGKKVITKTTRMVEDILRQTLTDLDMWDTIGEEDVSFLVGEDLEQASFDDVLVELRNKFKDDPIEYFRFFFPKLILADKIKEFILSVHYRKDLETGMPVVGVVVKGPRGGGKSQIVAGLEHKSFIIGDFDTIEFDCVNLGGSEKQANRVYHYLQEGFDHPKLKDVIVKSIQSLTQKRTGATIEVLSASTKQIRGPHAGTPTRGGLLVFDEEAEMEREIYEAAGPIIDTANPPFEVHISTLHKFTCVFRENWDRAAELGYARISWDVFDVMGDCIKDCPRCIPDFAYDTYWDMEKARTVYYDPKSGKGFVYVNYKIPNSEFEETGIDLEEIVNESQRYELIHPAFCGGKAIKSIGHIPYNNIVDIWRRTDLRRFQIEYMGTLPSYEGLVFDPEHWKANVITQAEFEYKPNISAVAGWDFGFASPAISCLGQWQGDILYIFDWDGGVRLTPSQIAGIVSSKITKYKLNRLAGDAEDAGTIGEIRQRNKNISVNPIPFNKYKKQAIQKLIDALLRGRIKFVTKLSVTHSEWLNIRPAIFKEIDDYRWGANEMPIKGNDHNIDALLSLVAMELIEDISPGKGGAVRGYSKNVVSLTKRARQLWKRSKMNKPKSRFGGKRRF